MISKEHWGIGYLAGTGVSLSILQVWWFSIGHPPSFTSVVGTTTGVILAASLVYLAYWLAHSALEPEHVWTVTRWGAIGLAIPTVPLVVIAFGGLTATLEVDTSVLLNVAAASSVIGALFGAVTELETEHLSLLTLNRRNVVLNRVLRHDVLNDASVLLLHAERLQDEIDEPTPPVAEPIREKTEEIIELSKTAGRIDGIQDDFERHPVNVIELIDDLVTTVRNTHPSVTIETELPETAWVLADELLRTVIDNLIENAIEHNDQEPDIHVSVTEPPDHGSPVEIVVADNGPGLPDEAVEILTQDEVVTPEEAHVGGLGLWLVKWFVDAYAGELTVDSNQPRGSIVRIALPAASPPTTKSNAASASSVLK